MSPPPPTPHPPCRSPVRPALLIPFGFLRFLVHSVPLALRFCIFLTYYTASVVFVRYIRWCRSRVLGRKLRRQLVDRMLCVRFVFCLSRSRPPLPARDALGFVDPRMEPYGTIFMTAFLPVDCSNGSTRTSTSGGIRSTMVGSYFYVLVGRGFEPFAHPGRGRIC